MICTNGSLWTDRNMRELADQGLSSVIMSIDSHEVAKHEKNRGLPDVCRKIQRGERGLRPALGVQTTASVTREQVDRRLREAAGISSRPSASPVAPSATR